MQLHPCIPRKRLTIMAVMTCAAGFIPAAALATTAPPRPHLPPATRASASVTSNPSISVNAATLVANGATVQVVVTITCNAGDEFGDVNTTSVPAVGQRRQLRASRPSGFACTGKPQREIGSSSSDEDVNGARLRPRLAWSGPV